MQRARIILIALMVLGVSRSAWALKRVARGERSSIEWMTVSSRMIVHATVEFDAQQQLSLRIVTPVRGPMQVGASIRPVIDSPWIQALSSQHGKQIIAFLSPADDFNSVLRIYDFIVLNAPGKPVDQFGWPACTVDGQELRTPEDVLSAVQAAAAWDRPGPPTIVNWEQGNFGLMVPRDTRLENASQKWIATGDLSRRTEAARCISTFKSDENISLLKQLLSDPETVINWSGPVYQAKRYIFPARERAWLTLRQWNVDVPQPTCETPHWILSWCQQYPWRLTTGLAIALVPPIAWMFLRRRRSKSHRYVEPRSWVRIIGSALVIFSTVAAVAVGHGWYLAARHAFHIRFDRERASFVVNFHPHRIEIARVMRPGIQINHVDWNYGTTAPIWTAPNEMRRILAVEYGSTKSEYVWPLASPLNDAYISMPTAFPFVLTSLPLLIWLLRQRHFAQRRHRADHGHCLHCGYDLRHSPDRCPECGRPPVWIDQKKAPVTTPSISS